MSNLYFPQLFTQPAKTFDSPSNINVIAKSVDQMNKLYYSNRDNYYDNIQTPLDKVQVGSQNQALLNKVKQETLDKMSDTLDTDAFHKAGSVIKDVSRFISGHGELNMALSDYATVNAKKKQVVESKYTADYKDKYMRMIEFNTKAVRTDESGRVISGVDTSAFVDNVDTKQLDELLATVSGKGDYPITETEIESLTNSLASAGVGSDVDSDGNPSSFVLVKNGKKYIDKKRVVSAVSAKLRNSPEVQDALRKKAELDMFDLRYKASTKMNGKAPTKQEELVAFNEAQVIQATKSSGYDMALAMNHYKDDKSLSAEFEKVISGDKSANTTLVDNAIAGYYRDMGADYNREFQRIYTNGYVNREIQNIANPIGDQLAFSSISVDYQIVDNKAYSPTPRGGSGSGKEEAAGIQIGAPVAAGAIGTSLQSTGLELYNQALNNNKVPLTMLGIAKYDAELKVVMANMKDGASVKDLSTFQKALYKHAIGENNSAELANMDTDAIKEYNRAKGMYDESGLMNASNFNSKQEYEAYKQKAIEYNQLKFNDDQAKLKYGIWHAGAKGLIDRTYTEFIQSDKWKDVNTGAAMDIFDDLVKSHPDVYAAMYPNKAMSYVDNINRVVTGGFHRGALTRYTKLIRENPNHAFSIEASKRIREAAPAVFQLDDIYGDGSKGGVNYNDIATPLVGSSKETRAWIQGAINNGNSYDIITSTVSTGEDKNDMLRMLKDQFTTKGSLKENIQIHPLLLEDGRLGATVRDIESGNYMMIGFDIPEAQLDGITRSNVSKAQKDHRHDPGLRSHLVQQIAKPVVGRTNVSVNGTIMPTHQATAAVSGMIDAGNDVFMEFVNPSYHLYPGDDTGNKAPVNIKMRMGKGNDGRIFGQIVSVNGDGTSNVVDTWNNYLFPYDTKRTSEGITYTPQGYNSVVDQLSSIFASEIEGDYQYERNKNKR